MISPKDVQINPMRPLRSQPTSPTSEEWTLSDPQAIAASEVKRPQLQMFLYSF